MPISVGSRIGPYEILSPLGAGGMGEVYRARDAKLNRDVAIKVLPELFSADPERLARFRREAQLLASLNHQNIGHIYGLEDSSGVHALVLELVEGPTLADGIAEGPIPLDEAIPIARQIADALECAHEQGIIHRDLKPANVKLRPDGTVKVLDFGLAKALDPGGNSSADAMNSPTLTARGTQLGVIVGTAAYMAPEQARGKPVDRRADIWAFGVVLYEMLSGKRAFEGDDVSITLAAVLKDDPDWKALPADLPPSVMRVLRRCLEKDNKRRLSAIGDARLDLEDAAIAATEGTSSVSSGPRATPALLPWAIALAGVTAAGAAFAAWGPWRPAPQVAPVRVSGEVGADIALAVGIGSSAVLSRDGETVVFVGMTTQGTSLYVRRLSELQATLLPGTEGAHSPFFSPDGQSIAFFTAGVLKKVAVTGGATMTICPAPGGRGGWWGDDNTIVFQPSAGPNAILHRVYGGGGTPAPIGVQAPNETTQRWPQILPGGRGVLYTGNDGSTVWGNASIMVQPLDGSAPKLVLRSGYQARYASSGHLLFMRESTLYAVPFDLDRLEAAGDAVRVVDGVVGTANTGGVQFSVADNGTLVYVAGRADSPDERIYTMEASGKTTVIRAQGAEWFHPRYSPDGSKLAITIRTGPDPDIWIHEPERDLTKFTFEPGADFAPVWTPKGDRIAFASTRSDSGPANVYWQRSNGTGPITRLTTSPNIQVPYSFDRSGRYLAFTERNADSLTDIMILPLEGDDKAGWKAGTPTAFLNTPANEASPAFSPDGKWLAYTSNESGTPEIYVRPFPSGDDKRKISNGGGVHPRWSQKKNELFYIVIGPQNPVMVVPYRVDGNSFVNEAPKQWSPQAIQPHGQDVTYDLHPDGLRIVMGKPPDAPGARRDKAVFVFNFFDELRRVAPGK